MDYSIMAENFMDRFQFYETINLAVSRFYI